MINYKLIYTYVQDLQRLFAMPFRDDSIPSDRWRFVKNSDCKIFLEHDVQSLIFFNCNLQYSPRGTKVSGE